MDNGKVMLQVTPWGIVMLQLLHATGGGTCHRGHLGIIKVTLDLHGCPRGKNLYARHFKGKHGNLYIIGKLNKCRFQKKIWVADFFQFRKRKSQTTMKMTMCHSIELIGYQIQAHWQNNCTVLITKDQSSKVCQHFSILTGYFLINLSSSSREGICVGHCIEDHHGWNIINFKIPDTLLFHNRW